MKKLSITAVVAIAIMSGVFITSCQKTETTPQVQNQATNNNPDPNNNGNNGNNGNNNNPDQNAKLTYTKKTAPLFFEFTSTGCPGCGSWGKPTFKSLISTHGTDITPLAVHIKYGDPMITTESNEIAANRYGQFYTPQLWVGDNNGMVVTSGINGSASIAKMNDLIATDKAKTQPSLAAVVTKEGNMLKVTYGVKFIDIMASGEYSVSAYLTEDGIEASQASSASNPTIHNNVIRTSAAGTWGQSFVEADLTDMEKSWSHSFDISAYNKDNVYVTVVLWKKDGTRYQAVNGYVAK